MPATSTTDMGGMKEQPSIARILARFCVQAAATDDQVPESVLDRAKLCVADFLHAAICGAGTLTGDLAWAYVSKGAGQGGGSGGGSCTAVARGTVGPEEAALYNGSVAAVHEIDDVHFDTSMHPGAAIVPAALAAAEWAGNTSGRRFLTAVAVGYEVAIRLSIAVGYRHYHFFHSAATCGAVGAAAAAAVAANLTEEQARNAIGLAATMASGLWEGLNSDAVMAKHLHLGLAAERGVRAALLAGLDWPASATAIEGDRGFIAALARPGEHAPGDNPSLPDITDVLTAGLGSERWAILRNIFKRYPFCLGCFEGIEGVEYILDGDAGRRLDDISKIVVEASPSVAWMVGQSQVTNELQAKFSMPYALALVLSGRGAEHVPMQKDAFQDPVVLRWLPMIEVVGDPEFGRRRARVTITWRDGSSNTADRPLVNMTEEEVMGRLERVAHDVLGERSSHLIESVRLLDEAPIARVRSFLASGSCAR